MKRITILALLVLVFCSYDPVYYREEIGYSPVLMDREDLENSIVFTEPRNLEEPGKIYMYGQYIFINDKYKGFHVFDNTVPGSPVNLGFIKVPGSLDVAVKDGILFADNATDLIAIEMSDMKHPVVTERIVNVFPETYPPGYSWMPYEYSEENRPANTIIIGWIKNE